MNPILRQLGFSANDRVLVIHADDIGMGQATISILADLFEVGIVTSAATMVPCPWFLEAAKFCRAHPDIDMGVHLTLNCEWERYRWGPISTRDPRSGLLDEQGYQPRQPSVVVQQAELDAVAQEVRMQLEWALRAGIDVTHIDTHMGTLFAPRFVEQAYMALGREFKLPFFFLTQPATDELMAATGGAMGGHYDDSLWQQLQAKGAPLFDSMSMLPLNDPHDHAEIIKRVVDGLSPGLHMLILHPAQDTPELRAIVPDWDSRVANYRACLDRDVRAYIANAGVQLIGYRPIREALRSRAV